MAEENRQNKKKTCHHKPNVRCSGNGWIVCRSQKRPGLLYDFNTLTGEAIWRESDKVEPHHCMAMLDHSGKYDCHEPTEPPTPNPAYYQPENVTQSPVIPNIYSKQIINNQFPGKPFTIAPFGSTPYSHLLNSNNNIGGTPAHVWVVPPTPQVLLGPAVGPVNPVQSVYGGIQNVQMMQSTSVPLSNRFQVLNHLNNERPTHLPQHQNYDTPRYNANFVKRCPKNPNDLRTILSDRKRQDLQDRDWPETNRDSTENVTENEKNMNTNYITPRYNPNFVKRCPKSSKDLRNILSDWKRQDLQDNSEDCPETNRDSTENVTVDEINPDDTDEWLEAHLDDEGKKLKIDLECIWKLANSNASRDCWYIVTSSRVLLKNIKFFSSLVTSDDRLRLLAPQEVVRGLRSATFSDRGRYAECAKRLLFALRQNKFPGTLKDATIVRFSSALIEQNKHVVLISEEQDLCDPKTNNIPKFSINELKQYLTTNNTDSKIQTICKNITITVPNTETKPEKLSNITPSPSPQNATGISSENVLTTNETSTEINKTEIQTGLTTSSGKRTANACVQTDFNFTLTQCGEIRPAEGIKLSPAVDINEDPNDNTAAPKKIKLRRQHQSANVANTVASDSLEKKTFKWRKRKYTSSTPNLTPSHLENCPKSCSYGSSPSTLPNDLTQQNDYAGDCELSDGSFNANIVEETSTSGVISNSIDSDNMFKINKQAILNESKADQKEDIVMYQVTDDLMKDRLKTRCEEWLSRFVQTIEEVLTQVLHLEPAFINATLPAPWTVQEATICIKRKFKGLRVIEDASDKFAAFLFKISDNRGNIKTDLSPPEFMKMFSYGVNLITVLQSELTNSEDLQIASKSLFDLLSDIRDPNLDEADETFNDDNLLEHSANVSGTMTNLSTDVPDDTVPDCNDPPRNEEKLMASNDSPGRYSLRSSRIHTQKKVEEKSEAPCITKNDTEYSLFSSLGLQKKIIQPDICIIKTIRNTPQEQQRLTPLADQPEGLALYNIHGVKENNKVEMREPTFIRNFCSYPELEMKLKNVNNSYADFDEEYAQDDNCAEGDGGVEENVDFTEDVNLEDESFIDESNYDLIQTTAVDVEQSCESTKSGDVDANGIFKWVVQRTTYDYNRCLVKLRRFCEETDEDLKSIDYWDPEYKTYVMEKTIEASTRAINLCDRLKRILNREPSVTKNKFRDLFKVFGSDADMSDLQLREYRLIIEKYSKHADLLLTFVTLLVGQVKDQ